MRIGDFKNVVWKGGGELFSIEMEPVRIFLTRSVIFKIYAVDRFLTGPFVRFFFTKSFCSLFNASNEKFSKVGGHGGGVKICDSERGS